MVWQDTLLSLCFDRPPATITHPVSFNSPIKDNLSYFEAMYDLQQCALEGMNTKMTALHDFNAISTVVEKIDRIYDRVQEHLGSLEGCLTFQQRCEHYAFRLHTSFVSGWLCRGAFTRSSVPESQQQVRRDLIIKGKVYLVRSLRAYLNLHPLCLQASRSWAYIHNGLSSALVLGLLGETKTNPEARELQGALIQTLSLMKDSESEQIGTGGSVSLSKLHQKALAALESLYKDQTQGLAPEPPPAPKNYPPIVASVRSQFPVSEPPAYATPIPQETAQDHLPPQYGMGVSGSWEMSPMELFDSIIWGKMAPLCGVPILYR